MKIKENVVRVSTVGFTILLVYMVTGVKAQQHPIYTQYMFNGLVINPAYAGNAETMVITASARKQWTGIQDAPQTGVFSMHSPIKFSRSAAGLIATYDRLGVTRQSMLYGTYAYHLPVTSKSKIAIGAQAGATFYGSSYSDLDIVTDDNTPDPAFEGNESRTLPNLGIGIFYYSERTYVGLSLPTLINNRWNRLDPLATSRQQRHYFLSAGHVFDLNRALKLKPNVLMKWVEGGQFQYDLNINMLIHDVVWAGISYRMEDSFDILLQWNIFDQLSVGYSYGYPTSDLSALQSGTHEVMVSFRVKRDKNIIFSPRYY